MLDFALAISPRIARRRCVLIIVVLGLFVWMLFIPFIYISLIQLGVGPLILLCNVPLVKGTSH